MTEWTWLGDHLALDFANTVRADARGVEELIDTPQEFRSWLAAEPADLPELKVTRATITALKALRDASVELLAAAVREEPLPSAAVQVINDAVAAGAVRRLLTPRVRTTRHTAEADDPLARMLGVLAASVVDLLGRDDLANLARCPAPACGQFFHRSRPNMRWCSPGCGNRARVDRHRHRAPGGATR